MPSGSGESGLWIDFQYQGVSGAKNLKPIGSPADLEARIAAWKPATYVLSQDTRERHSEIPAATISFGTGGFGINCDVSGAWLDERRATLLQQFVDFVLRVHAQRPQRTKLTQCSVWWRAPYPRVRPPHNADGPLTLGTLVNILDVTELRGGSHTDARDPSEIEALLDGPLPDSARRERHGDLVVIQWAPDLASDDAVAKARTEQERWCVRHLKLPRSSDCNEFGDKCELVIAIAKHDVLTAYREGPQIGYKAIMAKANGEVDEAEWAELAQWAKLRKLPDGTPLAELKIIVPIRHAALQLRQRALADGMSAVLYPDNSGKWWDVAPNGEWVDSE